MNEIECLYRIMGMLEGCEELGGLSSRLVSKIKEMISVVVKESSRRRRSFETADGRGTWSEAWRSGPVIYREPETVQSTVTTSTGQQVVVKHPDADRWESNIWMQPMRRDLS